METKLKNLLNILETRHPGIAFGGYVNMVKRNYSFLEECNAFTDANFRNSILRLIAGMKDDEDIIGELEFDLLRHDKYQFISGTMKDEENSINVELFFFEEVQKGFIRYSNLTGAKMGAFMPPKQNHMFGNDAQADLSHEDINLN